MKPRWAQNPFTVCSDDDRAPHARVGDGYHKVDTSGRPSGGSRSSGFRPQSLARQTTLLAEAVRDAIHLSRGSRGSAWSRRDVSICLAYAITSRSVQRVWPPAMSSARIGTSTESHMGHFAMHWRWDDWLSGSTTITEYMPSNYSRVSRNRRIRPGQETRSLRARGLATPSW